MDINNLHLKFSWKIFHTQMDPERAQFHLLWHQGWQIAPETFFFKSEIT